MQIKQNTIEQVMAEWYEIRDYFIRRNMPIYNVKGVKELDVIAFHPSKKKMVHIEASTNVSQTWAMLKLRFEKKFARWS